MRHIKLLTAATLLAIAPLAANATVIGGNLLDANDANQLETWLGAGNLDFTNIWTGTAGVSTASDFHNAVDGQGPTFSIFGITRSNGTTARIGGFTSLDWSGHGYQYDSTAFIFNLDTEEVQFTQHYNHYSIYRRSTYFSTFGGGHDIFGGYGVLGSYNGYNNSYYYNGYTYSHSYDQSQGQITIAGDSGYGAGNSGTPHNHLQVNSLEVYTFADSVSVPEPGSLALLGMGVAGMGLARRKRKS